MITCVTSGYFYKTCRMQEVNPNRHNRQFTIKVIVLVIVCVCACCLIFGMLMMIKRNPSKTYSKEVKGICTSKLCLQQAARIRWNMDISINPCVDFYNFTCGNFMRNAEIPKDQTRLLLALENKKIVEDELLAAYNANPNYFIKPIKNLKTFYNQCTTSEKYKHRTYKSLKKILRLLKWPVLYKQWNEKFASAFNWLEWETRFSVMGLAPAFLNIELKYDMKNFSTAFIGLDCTVPSISKEILESDKIITVSKEYTSVIKKFIMIIGEYYDGKVANEIVDFSLNVENIKPSRYEMSDANYFESFRNITVGVLEQKLNITLSTFLQKVLPKSFLITDNTVLGTNSYQCLLNMTETLNAADKRATANYMIWIVVQNLLWILSNETRQLDFRLNHAQTGVQAPLPLYRRCLNFIDDQIPELSSAMYIKMHYSKAKRDNLEKMVKLLITELHKVVEAITWMDKPTKDTAKEKVIKLKYVINHVDAVVEENYVTSFYGNLKMTSPNIIKNVRNIQRFAHTHLMQLYHWPPEDRNQISLLPLAHVVNAFYHSSLNTIAIPTGIAHGCIYSDKQEAYLNFGAIGIIIGHELGHVFDNVGRLYDADGNYVNWWSNKSNSKYEEKSRCFVKQYDNYTLGPKLKLNGTLTLGENLADTGGTLLAYRAYTQWKKHYKLKKLPGLEKYTLEQLFWITVGNTWCDKVRPETLETFLKTDVHSIGNFRVIGPLSNSKQFSKDFKCPKRSPMNRKNKCTMW